MEKQASAAANTSGNTGTEADKAKQAEIELKNKKHQDTLLASFSYSQKEYIIEHLYPEVSKALVHFVGEASRLNAIPKLPEPAKLEDPQPPESHS